MDSPAPHQPSALATLSHEFRTPLNAVLGMARLLEGTRLTAEQKSYVAALKSSGDHLLALVGDVLDMARLEAGAVTLNLQPVNIAELLQTVAELLSPRAHEKGLEIAWAAPKGLPPVMGDEGRLRQVLFNLAGNAVKFTDRGGVLLGCDFEVLPQGDVRLRLTVRDTGPGVPADRQSRIFEAFTHADDGDGARTDSTGLGLAIVKRLAETCHGSAGVDSQTGEGSTFWFEATFEAAGEARSSVPLAGVTVMIASPSLIVREAAQRQIQAAGGKGMACLTNEDAQRRAPPGAVVLVDEIPGKIRPVVGHPCLVLLRPESRPRINRSREAGFAGYLIKPLRQTSLSEWVLSALGRGEAGAPAPADERADTQPAKGARVLLVEDNPINALLARKLLEREGCVVSHAPSAEEAMLAAEAMAFDLILMDRRLPGADGVTATRQMRAAGITSPIVALTADAFEEDRRACLAAGMDDFLTKPLDPAALNALLARVLSDGWTKARENAKLAS